MNVPQCPSCKAPLENMPQRKIKCKACGEPIFIKDTPRNRTKRLMTTAQAEAADRAWEGDRDKKMRTEAATLYRRFLVQLTADLEKYTKQGFCNVQVFGENERTCPVCRGLMGRVLPVSTPAAEILRPDCQRLGDGFYHCVPFVSPVIKDDSGNVRFDRFSPVSLAIK